MDDSKGSRKSEPSDEQNDSEAAKRKLIQDALRDLSLSDHERGLKVREVLDSS